MDQTNNASSASTTTPTHSPAINAWRVKLGIAINRANTITETTPRHLHTLRYAKLITLIAKPPTGVAGVDLQNCNPNAYIQQVEAMLDELAVQGSAAWGTSDGDRIRRAIHSIIDAMEAVIEAGMRGCEELAEGVKEKAERANVMLLILSSMPNVEVVLH